MSRLSKLGQRANKHAIQYYNAIMRAVNEVSSVVQTEEERAAHVLGLYYTLCTLEELVRVQYGLDDDTADGLWEQAKSASEVFSVMGGWGPAVGRG